MGTFGNKAGSLKALKRSLAKKTQFQWIKYVPKNSTMNVRFATEPEEWVSYVEHYDQILKRSYPCDGNSGKCPGCVQGDRKTNRYLTNAIDLDNENGPKMVPLQLPKDLANRLVSKYEKWGTLTDRDIELSRDGEGLETVYDYDAAAPSRMKMDKFDLFDLEEVLQNTWDDVFGSADEEEEEEAPRPRKSASSAGVRGRKASAAARAALTDNDVEEDDEDDDEDDEPAPPPKRKPVKAAQKAAARKKAPEPVFEEDDEDDEEEPDDEPEADDDEKVYTLEELKAMKLGVLRQVARDDFGLNPTGKTAKVIIQEIIDSGDGDDEDDEDDEPPY